MPPKGASLRRRIQQQSQEHQQQSGTRHSNDVDDQHEDDDGSSVVSLLSGTVIFSNENTNNQQNHDMTLEVEYSSHQGGREGGQCIVHSNDGASTGNHVSSPSESLSRSRTATPSTTISTTKLLNLLFVLIHVVSVGCYIYGWIVRIQHLHTGEECEMTYSYREFIPIHVDVNDAEKMGNKQAQENYDYYRLYKFVDRRDLRHHELLKEVGIDPRSSSLSTDGSWKSLPTLTKDCKLNHCDGSRYADDDLRGHDNSSSSSSRHYRGPSSTPVHVVLYIPGHWGSYSQARSIGAHGIQLTRPSTYSGQNHVAHVQRSLLSGEWNGIGGGDFGMNSTTKNAIGVNSDSINDNIHRTDFDNVEDDDEGGTRRRSIDKFIFEVYAVDFHEQGGALHGQFLLSQSEYVALVVKQLIGDCFDADRHGTLTPSITLVGHSMGGYVARLTHLLHPEVRPYIRNIVTLATPHANPLYAFDKSIYKIHQKMMRMTLEMAKLPSRTEAADAHQERGEAKWSDHNENAHVDDLPTIVAISGGLRDEMIAPTACQLGTSSSLSTMLLQRKDSDEEDTRSPVPFMSVLSTHLMIPNPSETDSHTENLGMDHRAIAWCHQVLDTVRKVIWAMALPVTTNKYASHDASRNERLKTIRQVLSLDGVPLYDTFRRDEADMRTTLSTKFGRCTATFMEASMLYNLPYLLGLFLVISGLKFSSLLVDFTNSFGSEGASILATMSMGLLFSDAAVPWTATILLTVVAHTVNVILTAGFGYVLKYPQTRRVSIVNPIKSIRRVMVGSMAFVFFSAFGVSHLLPPGLVETRNKFRWDVLAYAYVIVVTLLTLLLGAWYQVDDTLPMATTRRPENFSQPKTKLHFFVITLLTLPVTLAGPVMLMSWEHSTRSSSWETLLLVVVPLILWSFFNILSVNGTTDRSNLRGYYGLRSLSIVTCTIGMCPWIFSRGHGFMAQYFLACLGWIDVAFAISNRLSSRPMKKSE